MLPGLLVSEKDLPILAPKEFRRRGELCALSQCLVMLPSEDPESSPFSILTEGGPSGEEGLSRYSLLKARYCIHVTRVFTCKHYSQGPAPGCLPKRRGEVTQLGRQGKPWGSPMSSYPSPPCQPFAGKP